MKNKLKVIMLASVMTVVSFFNDGKEMVAKAADIAEIPSTEIESVYNLPVDSNAWEGWVQGPQIYSESGIVMDIDSGAILYAKNIDDKHYPASITKVMTALVALQHYEMDETVHFTWDDIGFLEYGDAHIGIKPDEELTMEDCMFGMLLASANEVSHAIGAHMEGGYEEFLKIMNETSEVLGCQNSNWMNTHGLHDPEHYTSCRDMALIGSEVFQYEKFREITGTYQHTIPVTNITNETRTFQQNHKMLREWDNRYYEYCVGGKTGYTDQALTTLVTYATKKDANNEDVNLVAVVMRTHGGGNNAYVDTRAMLDYAFDNFSRIELTAESLGNENIVEVDDGAYVVLPNGVSLDALTMNVEAPADLGDKTGQIVCMYGDIPVGEAEMLITDEYYNQIHGIKEVKPDDKDSEDNRKNGLNILKIMVIVIVIFLILFILLMYYVSYKRRLMRRKRRQRRLKNKEIRIKE